VRWTIVRANVIGGSKKANVRPKKAAEPFNNGSRHIIVVKDSV
jgi:hypothetical protein